MMRDGALLLLAVCGAGSLAVRCGDHDYRIGRVGGPVPSFEGGGLEAGRDATLPDQPDFPCEVRRIVRTICGRCHGGAPEGAHVPPFQLVTWDDTQRDFQGEPIVDRMEAAIATDFMPLTAPPLLDPPVEPLTPEQKGAMLDWLRSGAQPVDGARVTCSEP